MGLRLRRNPATRNQKGASGFVNAAAFEVLAWLEGKGYVESGYRLGVLAEDEGEGIMYSGYLAVKFTVRCASCIRVCSAAAQRGSGARAASLL